MVVEWLWFCAYPQGHATHHPHAGQPTAWAHPSQLYPNQPSGPAGSYNMQFQGPTFSAPNVAVGLNRSASQQSSRKRLGTQHSMTQHSTGKEPKPCNWEWRQWKAKLPIVPTHHCQDHAILYDSYQGTSHMNVASIVKCLNMDVSTETDGLSIPWVLCTPEARRFAIRRVSTQFQTQLKEFHIRERHHTCMLLHRWIMEDKARGVWECGITKTG